MRFLLSLLLFASAAVVCAQEAKRDPAELEKLEKQRAPKPTRFALVFSNGYAGDQLPKDEAEFEKLLTIIKAAGFNVVHGTYTAKRVELCKKHDVQLMVDLLAEEHHVYKSVDKAKAVCTELKNNPTIWGYNIWNDPMGKTGEGRRRDVNNVREWDPTHPAFCGTYRTDGMRHVVNGDAIGYYDFHWKRGRDQHFPHLNAYWTWAKERDAYWYSWLSVTSGLAGKGNYNRSLWSANTSIAFGQKGILWFLGTEMMDKKTLTWTEFGKDIGKVHQQIAPLVNELAALGNPVAVYSTPITNNANNDPVDEGKKEVMPLGLEKFTFPKEAWLQPKSGEFLAGLFKDDVVYFANHNAYAEQTVKITWTKTGKVSHFDRTAKKWQPVELKDGQLQFTLAPAGGELFRVEKSK